MTIPMHSVSQAGKVTRGAAFVGLFSLSPHTPLWKNPNLPHFFGFEEPVVWTRFGVKKIRDIMHNSRLRTFDELKSLFNLPNTHFFKFIQLRHAYQLQYGCTTVSISTWGLETLLGDEDLVKPLSVLYK